MLKAIRNPMISRNPSSVALSKADGWSSRCINKSLISTTRQHIPACSSSGNGTTTVTEAKATQSGVLSPDAPPPWKWEESSDALKAYGVLAGVLAIGAIPNNPVLSSGNGSDLLYFISLAVCTQYIGAHRALTTTSRQQLTIKEGIIAPFAASISLFTCYLIIRFLPDLNISTLINAYFWMLGSFAGIGALGPVLKQVGGPLSVKSIAFDVPDGWLMDENGKEVKRAEFAPTDVMAILGGIGLSTAYLVTQDYSLNNAMACLIATDILQLIGIRSFRVAVVLGLGLLAYDVFWVFYSGQALPQVTGGESVMVSVATSDLITGPSRLLFPRTPGGTGEASAFPYALLGLGDIAIPGLLACLSLRYDASRSVDMAGRAQAAFTAIQEALSELPEGATGRQMGDAAANAAETAFDKFADKEQEQRQRTLDSTASASSSSDSDPSAPQALKPTEAVLKQRNYFTPVMVAYVGGLLMAFAANSITHLGQPALLYIVPCTLGAVLVTGLTREEVGRLWSFTDVPSFGLPEKEKDKNKDSK